MRPSDILLTLFQFFLAPALIGTIYLYFYPIIQLCAFPLARAPQIACHFGDKPQAGVPGETAPFRLLAFADPQLEGNTAIPGGPRGWGGAVREAGVVGGTVGEVGAWFARVRKRVDLWGNDRYLAHVRRSVEWWTAPTHVVVLGDLLGSQWIGGEEFELRKRRFWGTVFKGKEMVPGNVAGVSGRKEVLGKDKRWRRRVIAVPGNHDVGYAGDVSWERVERFEEAFGKMNWEITFKLNGTEGDAADNAVSSGLFGSAKQESSPELRLLMLNSMNLDGPAVEQELQNMSREFVQEHLYRRAIPDSTGTILLTHIPFHKPVGVCVDSPYFSYHGAEYGGGIKEQNHLSEDVTEKILSGLAGQRLENKAIVLNGHDHAGCDVYHRRLHDNNTWSVYQYKDGMENVDYEGMGFREITVRSMMGDYSGNAGLLSAWWDKDAEEWRFDYATCPLGVQHIWWAVHVTDIIVFLGFGFGGLASAFWEEYSDYKARQRNSKSHLD